MNVSVWMQFSNLLCPHVPYLAEAAAEVGRGVQQQLELMEGAGKVKAPEQGSEHHQEPVHLAPVAIAPEQPAHAEKNGAEELDKPAQHNPAEEEAVVNPNVEKQPPPVVHNVGVGGGPAVDGGSPKELGARGVPLHQREPDPAKDNSAQLKPEEIAAEEERVRQRLAHLEAERERIEKERLEKERIEKEVQARVERERKERERKENLAREQELERVRQEKERLEKERLEAERVQREKEKMDSKLVKMAEKEQKMQEQQEKLAQMQKVIDTRRDAGQNEINPKQGHVPEPLKKGGRDLKENLVPEDQEHPKNEKKSREEGDTDLRRRRRELGAEGRGVPRLEHLLELGGSDLHAALEGQLMAGAVVHSRQIKQIPLSQNPEQED